MPIHLQPDAQSNAPAQAHPEPTSAAQAHPEPTSAAQPTGHENARYRGLLVAIEGPDGAGKTTLARSLMQALSRELTTSVIHRRQPDNRVIRTLLVAERLSPVAEAVAFYADRAQQEVSVLRHLHAGHVVLVDRSELSSAVHQGMVRGEPVAVQQLHADFALTPPDILFALTADRQLLASRLAVRSAANAVVAVAGVSQADFELATAFKQDAVHTAYDAAFADVPSVLPRWAGTRVVPLVASDAMDAVHAFAMAVITAAIRSKEDQ